MIYLSCRSSLVQVFDRFHPRTSKKGNYRQGIIHFLDYRSFTIITRYVNVKFKKILLIFFYVDLFSLSLHTTQTDISCAGRERERVFDKSYYMTVII